MAETGCGDPPTDSKSSDLTNPELGRDHESREELVSKVAKLESQVEDVTSTLRDETENRRLIQHELVSSNSLCQRLEYALQSKKLELALVSQKNGSSREMAPSQHEQGIQTDGEMESDADRRSRNRTGRGIALKKDDNSSREKQIQQTRNFSAASLLVEEYKANQESLEVQVKKLSQECAAKDDGLSRVGLKCAEFIQKNVQLESEIESMRDELSKQKRVIDAQERQLLEKDSAMEEKCEMLKKLKSQRDSLSQKYYSAKRQATKLKEVVISFNKTVSNFRKEREHMATTVSSRGLAEVNVTK